MYTQVVLTVSEGKRLIAKGIAEYEPVLRARDNGILAIAKGTTNAYIVEEVLGKRIDKTGYVTGHVLPSRFKSDGARIGNRLPDVIIRKGEVVEGASLPDMVKDMKQGDVILKGANAINYEEGLAGVLIGHPTGGTVGAFMGSAIAKRVSLITPVGLEKEVPVDLLSAAEIVTDAGDCKPACPGLWVFQSELFTEIEAFRELADVIAMPIAAGGIAGAEGSYRFLLFGEEKEDIDQALAVVEEVSGEPPFVA